MVCARGEVWGKKGLEHGKARRDVEIGDGRTGEVKGDVGGGGGAAEGELEGDAGLLPEQVEQNAVRKIVSAFARSAPQSESHMVEQSPENARRTPEGTCDTARSAPAASGKKLTAME